MSKRKIKFRAWDGERMHPVCYLETGDNDRLYCVGPNQKELDGVPVMQYTGIKDKNGQEVYEGDIIEEAGVIGVVEWFPDESRFSINVEFGTIGLYGFYGEVVGNIHENPELLEQ